MWTRIMFIIVLGGQLDGKGKENPIATPSSTTPPLSLSLWQVYPHMAVLDWYITLEQKQR